MIHFEPYPFEKLNTLLKNITPDTAYEPIVLTIGEPQFETPNFIQEELCKTASQLRKYPKTGGEPLLVQSMKNFVLKRFHVTLSDEQIIPTFGTREVLFNFPQFLLHDKKEPVMALFYWEIMTVMPYFRSKSDTERFPCTKGRRRRGLP